MAAEKVSLKFDDLPKMVAERNLNLQGGQVFLESAKARTGHTSRSFLPKLNLGAGYESFKTGTYGSESQPYGALEAELNLYRGNRDVLENRLIHQQVEAQAANTEKIKREELSKARKVYWTLVFKRENARLIRDMLEQNEKILLSAKRRIARGVATDTDRLEFEMHHLELAEQLESFLHEEKLVELELAPLVGYAPGTGFETEDQVPTDSNMEEIKIGVDGSRFIEPRLAQSNQASAVAQESLARAGWKPALDLYGGYGLYTLRDRDYRERSDRDDTFVGARLNMALFDGNQSQTMKRFHRKQAEAFGQQTQYLSAKALADWAVMKEALIHETELIVSSQKKVNVGRIYFNQTLDEYGRGVKNSVDVLNAFKKDIDLKKEYAERRRNAQQMKADLLYLIGE
jgi:outer membrane protein TolC